MKKLKVVVILLLLLNVGCLAFANNIGMSNFVNANKYTEGQFVDVLSGDWYESNVKLAYNYGLMQGVSANTFNPNGNITIAETIVLASRIHSIYNSGVSNFTQAVPWYQVYVDYAISNGIIGTNDYAHYDIPATRAQFATILCTSIPDTELMPINNVAPGSLPDVPLTMKEFGYIYKLYNAGVLTGNDEYGTFTPNANIQRSAVAAITTRIVNSSLRKHVSLKSTADIKLNGELSSKEISQKCSPAVFYIETYGFNGEAKSTGSGFFISENGIAVTNYHVVANSIYNRIITSNGDVYDDISIIDYNEKNDIVLLKVVGTAFPYLNIGDSAMISQGQQVYAIGSPLGLTNTMSQGIISNSSRILDDVEYIQISVPINHGSSGGALIDVYGNVIGVTSAGFETTGDLNLAIPINKIEQLNKNSQEDYIIWQNDLYSGFSQALDFGSFSGTELLSYEVTPTGYIFQYDIRDFHPISGFEGGDCYAYTLYFYEQALKQNGFECTHVGGNKYLFESQYEIVTLELDLSINNKITVTTSKKPIYYNEFSKLPDFEWYSGVPMDSEPYYTDGSTLYSYRWIDYYYRSDFEDCLYLYFEFLKECGFKYIAKETETSYIIYLFEGNGLSICFDFTETELIIDILPIK